MSCYFVALINIHDREAYKKYEDGFMDIFTQYGGELLAVDENVEPIEGEWPYTRTVILKFASREEGMRWYASDEYSDLKKHRLLGSDAQISLIQGLG